MVSSPWVEEYLITITKVSLFRKQNIHDTMLCKSVYYLCTNFWGMYYFLRFLWSTIHPQSLKSNWQNFGLHWLESRIHVNSYIWHLQEMMASVNLTSCSSKVVVARLATSLRLTNPFHMTPIVNCDNNPEGNFVHISHQTRDNTGCFAKQTLSLDWTSLAVMSHVQQAW